MKVRDKLLAHLKTRKTPMTASMVAQRFACARGTAVEVMRKLVAEGTVKEVLVAEGNRYVRGIRA